MRRTNSSGSIDTSAATTNGIIAPSTPSSSRKQAAQDAPATPGNKSASVHYLSSYERMVRHQDLEFNATSGHAKHTFERIQTLGCKKTVDGEADFEYAKEFPRGMLTYLSMRRCLLRMGMGWNRSTALQEDTGGEYEDDVSVVSFNSSSSNRSGGTGSVGGRSDILATDAQLIMLLTTLVEMEERHRATNSGGTKGGSANSSYKLDKGLFLPDFVQAYKLIVGGMQSLKSIPPNNSSSGNPYESVCNRLKERTLGMLRPFGPNCRIYNDGSNDNSKQGTDALSSDKNSLRSNVAGRSREKKFAGFSSGEMTKVMKSKDLALEKIMEEHELEMDVLATNMEELRVQDQTARVALKRRRKRLRVLAVLVGGILVAAGVVVELRRRDFLANEIAQGREVERMAAKLEIANLKDTKRKLEKDLGKVEGKMRYQINRNDEVGRKTGDVQKKIDDLDAKRTIDELETDRCLASRIEINDERKREGVRKEEVEEESVWCHTRLRSLERKIDELEHVSVGASSRSGGDAGAIATRGGDDGATNDMRHKPVYLEMKYNKSVRNAMFLRQAYSAAAGLAASAALQLLLPAIIKAFAPPVAVVLPAVVPKQIVEMQIVDGIVGGSVIMLLLRALVTFVV